MNCTNTNPINYPKTNVQNYSSPIKSKFSIQPQKGSLSNIQNDQYSSTNLQESIHIIPRKLSPKPKSHLKQISNLNSLQQSSKLQTSTIIPINKVLRSGSSPNKNMIMTSPSKSIQSSNNQKWTAKSNVRYLPVNINLCQQNNNINHCQQNNKSIIRIYEEKSLSKKNMTNSCQKPQAVLNSPLKLVQLSPNKMIIGNAYTFHQNASENLKIQNILPSNLSKINSVKVINKINESMISTQRQNQLQRKVKFLQCRIAQLYQQRQQLQFKLNQENIKLQYQNKHLLTQLQHSLHQKPKYLQYQKQDSSQNCSSQTCKCKDADNMLKQLQKSEQNQYHQSKQIHALKASLNQVQDMLSKQIDKSLQLLEELQNKDKFYSDQANQIIDLKKKNSQLTSQNINLTKKIQSYTQQNLNQKNQYQNRMHQECLQQKENMYKNLIEQLKNNLNALQNKSKEDLEGLKKQMLETAQRNSEIIKYYQQKLEQHMLKIQTLENQVSQYQAQITQIKINFNVLKELQQNNNCLASQLRLFRQYKSGLEAQLGQKQKNNDFMIKQIEKFTFTIAQMNRQALDKQKCLQELIFDIIHKNKALEQLKKRTEELVIQLQESLARQQKLKMSNSNGFSKGNNTTLSSGSCQKCQQLRKTIFKLNNHLNRSSYTSQSMIQSKVSTNNN